MSQRVSLTFIIITLVFDFMGFGLIMPVLPSLITEVSGLSISEAALWGVGLTSGFALMRFLTGPILGNLSDRYGRRPVLIGSTALLSLHYLFLALAGSLWALLAGRILGGMTSASQSTGTAYVTDISDETTKTKRFGLIGAAMGVGLVLGPVLGGYLADFGSRAPFIAAAILAGANTLFGLFVLPESLPEARRRSFRWRRANPLGALRSVTRLKGTGALLTLAFATSCANVSYAFIWPYWASEALDWSPRLIGISLTIYGIAMALMQGLAIRPILDLLGRTRTVLLATAVNISAFLVLPFLHNTWVVLALVPLASIATIATPALTAQLSARTAENAQGELQGVIGSLNALAMVVAPLILGGVFRVFTAENTFYYLPGAPYVVAALMLVIALPIYMMGVRHKAPSQIQPIKAKALPPRDTTTPPGNPIHTS